MSAPAKAPAPAPQDEELEGDYRKALNKRYLGKWDLQAKDKSFLKARCTIARVMPYPCKSHPIPAHVLAKKQKQAAKSGQPMKREFVIELVGKKKAWILRKEAMDSVAIATGTTFAPDWKGKEIVLYFDTEVKFGREKVGGIRALPVHGNPSAIDAPLDAEPDEERVADLSRIFGADDADDFGDAYEPAP